MNDLDKYADFHFQLRRDNRSAVDVPAEFPQLDLDAAYAVQDKLVAKLIAAASTHRFGYKIGCTSKGAQQLLNTDGPVYGQMINSGRYASPVMLNAADFSMMVIEPEFAFELNADVVAGHYDAQSIRPFVASVIPSIEVVHHHLGSWDVFNAPKTIADNAIHGCWVAGQATVDWQHLDFVSHEVTLYADNEPVSSGRGEIALGDPLNALAWIANTLPTYERHLKAGEIVTTGVCMPVYLAKTGQNIRADFGILGQVEIQF
ncbi:MAG: 2-keto-4-pentenoate hydratase [Cellvibrionaceae bacterium]|jgi:2-keto-4-pentenoate hydratase